jgi:hypothetical protein
MPESVKDRPTKSHEYIFLLSKSTSYYYDYQAILEPAAYDGRKDTFFKGSEKYKNSGQTFAERGHQRWSQRMPPIGGKKAVAEGVHSTYSGNTPEYQKMRGFKTKEQIDNPQHHGSDIAGMDLEGLPARNKRDVWHVATQSYKEAHFATFPPALIEPCILAGCPEGGTVLDPFNGTGTTGLVAIKHRRNYIGIELNPKYIELTHKRLNGCQMAML